MSQGRKIVTPEPFPSQRGENPPTRRSAFLSDFPSAFQEFAKRDKIFA
jgi:hypothetical protein